MILLYPLGKLPPPANRTKENEIHCLRVCILIELFYQFLLGNGWQKITPTALAPGTIPIVTPFHGQFTQGLDEVPETYARWTPFGAYFTGKTIPDGIPCYQVRIKKRFLNNSPRRLPKLDSTKKLRHRTKSRTPAALKTPRKLVLLD
jgi:hypothetical protein